MGSGLRRHRSTEIVTDHPDTPEPAPATEPVEKPREKVNWLVEVRGLALMLLAVLAFHTRGCQHTKKAQ